jgi:WD40 repeat protein
MTNNSIGKNRKTGMLYSNALLSLMIVMGMCLAGEDHIKTYDSSINDKDRVIHWDVKTHKVKSQQIMSLVLTPTMGTGKTRLLTGCYTSGSVSLYEQSTKGFKATKTLAKLDGGITDIQLLSMEGSLNKAVVAQEEKGVIQVFDLHEDAAPITLFHGAQGITMIKVADLNGDGLGDIIPVSYDGKTQVWFENDKNQIFIKRNFPNRKHNVSAVQVADFDLDGDSDLLMASDYEKGISLLTNDGEGNFTETVLQQGITGVLDMVIADMNMDGKPDLAYVSHQKKKVQLLLKKETNFKLKEISTKLRSPNNIRVFDLTSDGRPDLVVSSFDDNTIRIIENASGGLREHQLQAEILSPTDIAVETDKTTGETTLYISSMAKNRLYAIDIRVAE